MADGVFKHLAELEYLKTPGPARAPAGAAKLPPPADFAGPFTEH